MRYAAGAAFRTALEQRLLPTALPPPPPGWETAYRKLASEVNIDPELSVGYEQARRFLDPVLAGTVPDDARWDAAGQAW